MAIRITDENFKAMAEFIRQWRVVYEDTQRCSREALSEAVPCPIKKGRIRVFREDNGEVLYQADNIITNASAWLFAQFMATVAPTAQPLNPTAYAPLYGVWGLALGSGSPTWGTDTQPVETAAQTSMVVEIARIQLSRINFVDGNFDPVDTLSTNVDFQTTVNATTNNITQGIREMGLIGGGNVNSMGSYTMQTAPYFSGNITQYSSVLQAQQTVIMLNYKTLPPLLPPPGINIIFSWVFSF